VNASARIIGVIGGLSLSIASSPAWAQDPESADVPASRSSTARAPAAPPERLSSYVPVRGSRGGAQANETVLGLGASLLGMTWLLHGAVISPFAGYHLPLFGSPHQFEDGWDAFRAWGVVPLVGPWVQLTVMPRSAGDAWTAHLVTVGLLEALGVAMLAYHALSPWNGVASDSGGRATLVPMVGAEAAGLAAVGLF
jgi:hypothetical protein